MKRIGEKSKAAEYLNILRAAPPLFAAAKNMQPPENDTAAVAGCYVLGPALSGFVRWVLQNAMEKSVPRLYFLARDGYFMCKAAKAFCARYALPVECRYLSCSRYAIRLPLFHLDLSFALNQICSESLSLTLDKILARAGLHLDERQAVCAALPQSVYKTGIVPPDALPTIRRDLANCPLFIDRMNSHSKAAFSTFSGYLKQEGLLDETPAAIVDSGWVGSMQKTLNTAIRYLQGEKTLEGYYWGLYALPPDVQREKYHWYFFGPQGNLRRKAHFNNCLFEAVFSAPHGMTLGYRKAGTGYEPEYAPASEKRAAFLHTMESYLLRFAKEMADKLESNTFLKADTNGELLVLHRLLRSLMCYPSLREAQVFGSLPFTDDVLEDPRIKLAPVFSKAQLRQTRFACRLAAAAGVRQDHGPASAWPAASIVQSTENPRHALQAEILFQYLRHGHHSIKQRKENLNGG